MVTSASTTSTHSTLNLNLKLFVRAVNCFANLKNLRAFVATLLPVLAPDLNFVASLQAFEFDFDYFAP